MLWGKVGNQGGDAATPLPHSRYKLQGNIGYSMPSGEAMGPQTSLPLRHGAAANSAVSLFHNGSTQSLGGVRMWDTV